MSAFALLALQNNAAATVNFNPSSIDTSGTARWYTADSVFDARSSVAMSVQLPKNGSQVSRIKEKVTIPVMDAIDATKKLGDAYISLEAVIPKNASETVRLDLRKYAEKLLAHAVNTAAFTSLESIY